MIAVWPTDAFPLRMRVGSTRQRQRSALLGRRAMHELLGLGVVLEHDAAIQAGELHGAGDDGRQHRLQVERRADRLAHLAERGELARPSG